MLLDTHVFLHLVTGAPVRFGDEYAKGRLVLSAITAAEVACLQRLGRVVLDRPADAWFEDAARRLGAEVVPVSAGLFARAMLLDWEHRDPADRVLVQLAIDNPTAPLHTRDTKILAFGERNGVAVRDCRL